MPEGDFCGPSVLSWARGSRSPASLGLGLLLGTFAANLQRALLLSFFTVFPVLVISGVLVPQESMPRAIQLLSLLSPLRYYHEIGLGIFVKGVGMGGCSGLRALPWEGSVSDCSAWGSGIRTADPLMGGLAACWRVGRWRPMWGRAIIAVSVVPNGGWMGNLNVIRSLDTLP